MNDVTQRRRRMLAAAIICITCFTLAPGLSPTPALARQSRIPSSFCPHDWRHGRRAVKRLIRCSVRRWHVPGGAHKAIVVARRESRFHPRAYNPAGYKGLYQQSVRYWRGRARRYGFPGWSAFNGRANVIVSIRMVHRGGWGPWSTA
jgi:soluble lytic murein transglycosylase-like protein